MIKRTFKIESNITSYNLMFLLSHRAKDWGFLDAFPVPSPNQYGYGDNTDLPIGFENLL